MKVECSHFVPQHPAGLLPTVIYLHGNSGSRLEALDYAHQLLASGFSVFCYDAAACGLSEGEYISLGWHERDDLGAVITHLRAWPRCGPLGLWGRSMGAVTALLYAERDPRLGAVVLDSPFASLEQLTDEIAHSDETRNIGGFQAPTWMIDAALAVIRMRVRSLAGFDIEDVAPVAHVEKVFVPALFFHSHEDDLISTDHAQQLFEAYAGDKQLCMMDGDHNSERSPEVVGTIMRFFAEKLRPRLDVGYYPMEDDDERLITLPLGPQKVPLPTARCSLFDRTVARLGGPPTARSRALYT
jgi:pimeloyl-ACP methyl ester carboxylesterase